MRTALLAGLLVASCGASAQGFDTQTTCYTWQGGNFSSGGFAKCDTNVAIVQERPQPPPPAPQAVTPAPVMMPMQTCAPEPKPIIKRKRKPPVKC